MHLRTFQASSFITASATLLAILLTLPEATVQAQNLVDNPSFEVYSTCPINYGTGGALEAYPWMSGGQGSADYLNECATTIQVDVPTNNFGYQPAYTGVAYAGIYTILPPNTYREFIQAELLSPLEADHCYYVSAWINKANLYCGIDQFGILFTPGTPPPILIGQDPQIKWTGGLLLDSINWMHIDGYYSANGTEHYITLGNFATNAETQFDPLCAATSSASYYYIDEVSVEEVAVEEVPMDLGPDAIACDSFVIDPPDDNSIDYHWSTGDVGPTLTVYESGVYGATRFWNCMQGVGEIDVTIQNSVYVDLDPEEIYLCDGDTYTFSLDPSLGDYTWDDGSSGPDYTVSTSGTYSVTLDDGCILSSDMVVVNSAETPLPFSLGPDQDLCSGEILEYSFDPSAGTFTWQDGTHFTDYFIDVPGTYALTISNFCGEVSDEIVIGLMPVPEVNLGPDSVSVCTQNAYTINLDSLPWSLEWQDGSTNPFFSINTPGTYSVTVTNFCGMDSDTIVATAIPTPVVDLGPDLQACPGDTIQLMAGPSNLQYLWPDGSTLPGLAATTSGTIAVTVTHACGTIIDSIHVLFTQTTLAPDLGPDRALCLGQSLVLDPGLTGVDYLWSDGTSMPSLMVSTPGVYAVTVSNSCDAAVDSVTITAGEPLPFVDLGNDVAICQGDTVVLHPAYANVQSWQWNDGSVLPTLAITVPGVVFADVANSCGTASDTMVVSLLPAVPAFSLGADTSICPGESVLFTISVPDVSVSWFDGSTGNSLAVDMDTVVFAMISNTCGSYLDSATVTWLPDIPSLSLGPDQWLCPGDVVTLSPGLSDVEYLWQDGSTLPVYQSTQAETVSLTISNSCGMASDTVMINESTNGPVVDLGPDIMPCEGDTISIASGVAGVQFLWQDGSTGSDYRVWQSGSYAVTVSNSCGADADTVSVQFNSAPSAVDLGADTVICEGQTLTLSLITEPGVQYQWQDLSAGNTYVVSGAGIYHLTASNTCGVTSDTIEVNTLAAPGSFSLGRDTLICQGASVLLVAPSTAYGILWQDGSASSSYTISTSGDYWLQLSNDCGTSSDTITVHVDDKVPVVNLVPEMTWCPGDQFTLNALQSFAARYQWSTGDTTSQLMIVTPGFYSVDVFTNCVQTHGQTEVIQADDCDDIPLFTLPNVFSPNGDGLNDLFALSTNGAAPLLVQGTMYDRWGNVVYSFSGDTFSWDGRYGGDPVSPGVYVYVLKVSYVTNGQEKEELLRGDVTVVK